MCLTRTIKLLTLSVFLFFPLAQANNSVTVSGLMHLPSNASGIIHGVIMVCSVQTDMCYFDANAINDTVDGIGILNFAIDAPQNLGATYMIFICDICANNTIYSTQYYQTLNAVVDKADADSINVGTSNISGIDFNLLGSISLSGNLVNVENLSGRFNGAIRYCENSSNDCYSTNLRQYDPNQNHWVGIDVVQNPTISWEVAVPVNVGIGYFVYECLDECPSRAIDIGYNATGAAALTLTFAEFSGAGSVVPSTTAQGYELELLRDSASVDRADLTPMYLLLLED